MPELCPECVPSAARALSCRSSTSIPPRLAAGTAKRLRAALSCVGDVSPRAAPVERPAAFLPIPAFYRPPADRPGVRSLVFHFVEDLSEVQAIKINAVDDVVQPRAQVSDGLGSIEHTIASQQACPKSAYQYRPFGTAIVPSGGEDSPASGMDGQRDLRLQHFS